MEKTIYLAEDDADIREVVEYLLSTAGFHIQSCASALTFKQKMAAALPDLIILDIMLPDGNGLQLCQQLKSDPVTAHIPVLLMSANVHNRTSAQESLADDFISKPFDIEDLIQRVRRQLTPEPESPAAQTDMTEQIT